MLAGSRQSISTSLAPTILFGGLVCKMYWTLSFRPCWRRRTASSSTLRWHFSRDGGDSKASLLRLRSRSWSTLVNLNSCTTFLVFNTLTCCYLLYFLILFQYLLLLLEKWGYVHA